MVEKIRLLDVEELVTLADEVKNCDENIDISKLYVNSSKSINWKCKKGHSFKEKVSLMYRRKHKCFFCTGRQICSGENDLQTLYPELAKEFDVAKNGITPDKISPRDTTTYYWTCAYNHPSFQQSVEHRVNRKTVCPYCSGRKCISGENDLATLFPEIASEWDTERNKGVLPKDVSPYSYNSYAWICPKGHNYKKKVVMRTKFHKPIDCPKCIKAHSTSFPEQAIFFYVKKCFPDAVNRYKEPFENGMELDIYIPSIKFGIEYDGMAFHNSDDQHDREYRKYLACKRLGIKLIRIKESEESWTDTAEDIYYVHKKMKDKELSMFIWSFFSSVFGFAAYTFKRDDVQEVFFNKQYGFPTDFNVSRDKSEILEYLVDIEHSFGALYPEQAKLWSDKANGKLTPFMFPPGSNHEAIWECPKCGNTWKAPICGIVSRKVKSCRVCSMKANGKTITKVKTKKHGSLAEKNEILLRQWDYEANGDLSPYEIPLNYSFEVAWKCDKCGFKWSSKPNSRARKDGSVAGCPHCTGRVAMSGVDDFETLYPDLAKEWDYEKNGNVLPSQIKPFANKKYHWICPQCKKSYPAYPGNRIKGHGCPDCAHLKVGKKNSKPVGQYDDNGVLINKYYGISEAARAMGVVQNAIFQAVSRGRKSKGYYWKYLLVEDENA